ncbi:MAG: hypothetical protein M3Z87_03980 [Lactobacillus sp.]|nr:hypothetical protein [Lactobacillus sp.]
MNEEKINLGVEMGRVINIIIGNLESIKNADANTSPADINRWLRGAKAILNDIQEVPEDE